MKLVLSLLALALSPLFVCAAPASERLKDAPVRSKDGPLDLSILEIVPATLDAVLVLGHELLNSSSSELLPPSTSSSGESEFRLVCKDCPTSPISSGLRQSLRDKMVPFAGATYCLSVQAGQWSCGALCDAHPDFEIVSYGGNGGKVPHYYIGWNPTSKEIVIAHEGSDFSQKDTFQNDFTFSGQVIDPRLAKTFHPVAGAQSASDIPVGALALNLPKILIGDSELDYALVHTGFQSTWARSYANIERVVLDLLAMHPDTAGIVAAGHSLGAAIATLDGIALRGAVPASVEVEVGVFGQPRLGNPIFASLVDRLVHDRDQRFKYHHVVKGTDIVPHLGPLISGYQHSGSEVFIPTEESGPDAAAVLCSGQENTNCAMNPDLKLGTKDHGGPYFGIHLGRDAGS
ncbi:hypothetical protein OC844_007711, partial [Tilletia horrida]